MDKTGVLVVEDEPISAMEIRTMLENLGYGVLSVENRGNKALNYIEDEAADLVLMDINLKGPMDGIETTKQIRKESSSLPVVYLTAYSDEETLERVQETDPEGYLVKPVTEDDLRSTVKMALNRGQN